MKKRIVAWLLLLGFIFLILNIIVFHFYWEISLIIYIGILLYYVFFKNKEQR